MAAQTKPQVGQNIDINRYLPTKSMTIGKGGNRNPKNLPVDEAGREWSNGLFDCGNDMGTCVMACCCPCIVYGQNRARVDALNDQGQVNHEPEAVNNDCLVYGLATCFTGIGGYVLNFFDRTNVRARYNIKGDPITDILSLWCCGPCAITQQAQEIALEEQSLMGKQGYQ